MSWNEHALSVLTERYCWKDEKTPEEVFRRVACAIAQAEHNYCFGGGNFEDCDCWKDLADKFYDLMINQYFMPNSPTIMNAGTGNGQNLSACFVLPIPDSIEGILKALNDQVIIHKSGGGTGFSFSKLRPEGSAVNSTQGVSSGPVSFMSLFDKATDVIKQGGRRRGANMAILRVDHPDIIKFINCKLSGGITNFNISVGITDEFMQALENKDFYPIKDPKDNSDWIEDLDTANQRFPISYKTLPLPSYINNAEDYVKAKISLYAPAIFDLICKAAWQTGDPGLFFFDRANQYPSNPCPNLLQIESTNPCFTGDTLVWTIYGAKRFDQLVGKSVPVLTEKSDGTLVFRKMSNIRKTRQNAPVYEVTIRRRYGMRGTKSRLGTFNATPDHMIRMKNGEWKRVDELKEGDSVQSVYRSEANSKGYYKLTNGIDTDMEHRIITSYPNDKRPEYPEEHVHHRDEDKQNNKPNNIVPLPQKLHDRFNNSISDKAKEYEVVNHTIVSVKPVGYEDVYCGTVEETHSFFIMPEKDGGILVHNCLGGDTLVATADGRDAVSISQLANEGKDIPVYCYDNITNEITIRTGRNPRKTRKMVETYKLSLDDGSHIIATPDHNFMLRDGRKIQLRDLQIGASLMPFYKYVYEYPKDSNTSYYGINLNNGKISQEHTLVSEFVLGRKLLPFPEEIVHHKNYNGLNNKQENLQVMSQKDHLSLHQLGDRNVMRDKWWNNLSDDEKQSYRDNMSRAVFGSKNGMYGKQHTDETKIKIGKKTLERTQDAAYIEKLRNGVLEWYANNGTDHLKGDRVAREERICLNEKCQVKFQTIATESRKFCSQYCAVVYLNQNVLNIRERSEESKRKHRESVKVYSNSIQGKKDKTNAARASAKNYALQAARILLDNNIDFILDNWDEYKTFVKTINSKIHFISKKKILEYFGDADIFKELSMQYNHKVVSVEFYGYQDVYNLTVDDFHTVAYITNSNATTKSGKKLLSGIVTFQCGEQALEPNGVCNLGSLNLSKYVIRQGGWPYRDINTELLREHVKTAIRLLDNVIDINIFPTPEINEQTYKLRRVGLGIMGWADMLMLLGIPYDSSDALDIAEHIMAMIEEEAEIATEELAKEKGEFPLFENSIYACGGHKRRNSNLTTVAPTGTISFFANCLDGQTQIHTLDGNFPIKDLVGTKQLVYCLDATGNIKLRKAFDIRKTGNNMPVYKVQFDTGDYLIGTQEHPVLLTNGKYVSIKDLQFNDSVMFVEKRLSGYKFPSFKIRSSVTKWKTQYIIAAEDKFGRRVNKGEHVHHIDGNHLNDHPDNLDIIPAWKHSAIHAGLSDWNENKRGKTLEEIYGEEKALEIKNKMGISRTGEKNGRYGHVMTEEEKLKISIATKEAMQRPEVKERQRLGTERRSNNQVWKQKMLEHNQNMAGTPVWSSGKTKEDDPRIAKYGATRSENSKNRKNISNNHRVISIEFYGYEDVYNMEVEEFHNFVANGVVVHNCSSGIEPIFSLDYTHIAGNGVERRILNSTFQEIIANLGINNKLAINQIMQQIPEHYRPIFVTAHQLTPQWHIQHQATFQKYVDNSVSKTINMPNSATVEEISEAYQMAYDTGCMGITVYRNGCKPTQVLNDNTQYGETNTHMEQIGTDITVVNTALQDVFNHIPIDSKQTVLTRPNKTHGATYSKQTSSGKVHITINGFNGDNDPREMFVSAGKAGSDRQADCEAIGRLVSLYLRTEQATPAEKLALVAEQLSDIGGSTSYGFGKDKVKSIPDAIAAIIYEHLNSNGTESNNNGHIGDMCPDCGNFTLAYQEGCRKCQACGYSEC